MSTTLDPDELTCRRCGAGPTEVCRQPNGKQAAAVHAVRRRDSQATQPRPKPGSASRPSPGTPEGRRKGQATQAQNRRRRRAELGAAIEERKTELVDQYLEANAERIAADAADYAVRREEVRRTLFQAADSCVRLFLEAAGRVDLDAGFTPQDVEKLARATATILNSLRLEEGQPTGITAEAQASAADALGEVGVEELIRWASTNLPGHPGPGDRSTDDTPER